MNRRIGLMVMAALMVAMVLVSAVPASAQQPGDSCGFVGTLLVCIRVTPESDTKPVGSSHTVTAVIFPVIGGIEGRPFFLPGRFSITSGPDAGLTQTCNTPPCTFTFTNNGSPGTDVIEFEVLVLTIPPDTATVTFEVPPPAPGQQQPGQQQPGQQRPGQQQQPEQQPREGAPAPITQDFEQESESGEIDQTFDIS